MNFRRAFTLIEVLIVVAVMAIVAATVVPAFFSSTSDVKSSVTQYNATVLQTQIDLYMAHHYGNAPSVATRSLPQLLASTNATGESGEKGPDYPFGPYVADDMPLNAFTESNTVYPVATFPAEFKGWDTGWLYHQSSGRIEANIPPEAAGESGGDVTTTP